MRVVLMLCCALSWALLACADTTIEQEALVSGDETSFRTEVQTYVGYRCSSLDCHGDMGRMLRVYAEQGLRLDVALRNKSMSIEEIRDNLRSFAAFDDPASHVSQNPILLKALAPAAGGMAHKGGHVWESREEPGYLCMLAWLEGNSADTDARQACMQATAPVLPF